ncbi:hypothetical protein CB0940_00159 [Cercospora beticola]|uniref:Prolyl 4-hydroxylase alpha subunit domain-containing protein n=1 Tax=Cercospora beticola TaxID=122368 RepID=A0A2G5ICI4_CERBT|nr:hypothetical protein CB0940_00159 [Cercospora beticola]PIB02460.1 hypothetical protein CB0940_00159 [Cercospora beticola]WPA95562.1 hypothetical protein RHO25_000163 [Cercospora beticola]
MANESRNYRTALEIAVISLVIYFLVGAPGISSTSTSTSSSKDTDTEAKTFSESNAKAKIEHLVYPSKNLQCPEHSYTAHIYSTSPLMIYIENFLSETEIEHLISLSASKWTPSTTFNFGLEAIDTQIRKSEKASISRSNVVQCIEQRALAFQGWPKETFIERLWTQRYNISGHYSLHYDWTTSSRSSRRVSSFMVYLKDECRGGGTNFPRIEKRSDLEDGGGKWCQFIDCESEEVEGVTFMPRKGGAVFWANFDSEGRGYKETIHSGMPVLEGQKIGLNIWSWYQAGHRAPDE